MPLRYLRGICWRCVAHHIGVFYCRAFVVKCLKYNANIKRVLQYFAIIFKICSNVVTMFSRNIVTFAIGI